MEQGGGLSRRDGLRWITDFGYKWEEMPNFATHAVADEKHGDLFVSLLPKYILNMPSALNAATDAEPVLRQVLTVTPGAQEFVKNITKKHLQR